MDGIEFSRKPNKAEICVGFGKSKDEMQNHVIVAFSKITNICSVGTKVDKVESEEPFFGMMFFYPESIDALIHKLEKAKKALSESEAIG